MEKGTTVEKIYRDTEYEPLSEAKRKELVALAVRIKASLLNVEEWADDLPDNIRDSQRPAEDQRFAIDARAAASRELGDIMGSLVALENSLDTIVELVGIAITKLEAQKK